MLQGSEQLKANLKLVQTFLNPVLIQAMEMSQNLVVTHAKHNHIRGKSLSPAERKEHADERFYGWSQKLVDSIHPEKVEARIYSIKGEVVAGEKYATKVEVGGSGRRAFPYMRPALDASNEAILLIFAAAVRKVIK